MFIATRPPPRATKCTFDSRGAALQRNPLGIATIYIGRRTRKAARRFARPPHTTRTRSIAIARSARLMTTQFAEAVEIGAPAACAVTILRAAAGQRFVNEVSWTPRVESADCALYFSQVTSIPMLWCGPHDGIVVHRDRAGEADGSGQCSAVQHRAAY